MKSTVKKWINSSFKVTAFMVIMFALVTSCAEDELSTEGQNVQRLEALPSDQSSGPDSFSASISCPDDLTNDGCNFTSGTGRDHPNQFLMVNMMNNCRTESLPSNCTWDGNITQTRTIEVDLNNCCYPYSSLNFATNSWKALAASNRPAANYLITNYTKNQRLYGHCIWTL